jgi:hypothetical protein
MRDVLELIKKLGIDILIRFTFISIGLVWVLCILYILGFVSNVKADTKTERQSIYESAESLMTCSSAVRNTWSIYDTIKDEKTGKEIKLHSIANDLRIYAETLYKEVNPEITTEHLDEILGIRNTIFVTRLTAEERSKIVDDCIELLESLDKIT